MKIVLASTSPYRKALLQQLQLDFICASPNINETALDNETIETMVVRLARTKAENIASHYPDALIIGSDQSAILNGKKLDKPGNFKTAVAQLKAASGQKVIFQTGLCLLNATSSHYQSTCVPYTVEFRDLDEITITSYLKKEQPYNCAGSFKSEGLGISLFKRLSGDDPNALIGLPLIRLIDFLHIEGVAIPADC